MTKAAAKEKESKIDLDGSDKARADMKQKLGFIPMSVIREIRYGFLSSRMLKYQTENPKTKNGSTDHAKTKDAMLTARGRKGGKVPPAGTNREALSIMPAELVDFFVKFYCKPGDTYIDPFMAQGIQMQIARMNGVNYWGYDLSKNFFAYCKSILPKVKAMAGAASESTIQIFNGDSRFPDQIPDGIADFSFHSPPYWDIEFYGDEKEQLGTGQSYEDFLQGMKEVAAAWLPKFKPDAYHVVNIGDIRRDGKFYCYHSDLARVFVEAGWVLYDIWILDQIVASSNRIFAVSISNRKQAARVHEYALVFRKPK